MNNHSESKNHDSADSQPLTYDVNSGAGIPRSNKKSLAGRLLSYVISCLLALVSALFLGFIACVLLFVYSQDSREWTISEGIPALLSLIDIQLEVDNLASPSPLIWSFDKLSVRQGSMEIIHLEQLHLEVNDWSVFNQGLDIKELRIGSVNLSLSQHADKELAPESSASEINYRELLSQPFGLSLQTLEVQRFEVSGLALAIPALRLQGSVFVNHQSSLDADPDHWLKTNLEIRSLNDTPTEIKLKAVLDTALNGHLMLNVQEAVGGWLAKLIEFPEKQGIDGQLDIQLQPDTVHEQINWKINAFQLPWYQHVLGLNGMGNWQQQTQKLQIEEAELLVDQTRQDVNGWWQDQAFALNLDLNNLPLAVADPFQDIIKGGKVSGKLNASGSISNPQFSGRLELETTFLQEPSSAIIEAEGNLASVHIKQASLKVDKAKASVSGKIDIEQQSLDIKVAQLKGPVSIIRMFDVQLPEGLNIELEQTEGKLSGDILAPQYSGKTRAKGDYKTQAFTLNGGFTGNIKQVKLTSAKVTAEEANVTVNGLIDWHNSKLDLMYSAEKTPGSLLSLAEVALPENLSLLADSKGQLTGNFDHLRLEAKAQLKGTYDLSPLESSFSVQGTLDKLHFSQFSAQLGDAYVDANGHLEPLKQRVNLNINQLHVHTDLLKSLLAMPLELDAQIQAKGILKGPIEDLNYIGHLQSDGQYKQAVFSLDSELDAKAEAIEFKTFSSRLTMDDHEANVQANGRYSIQDNAIDGRLKIDALPISFIELAELDLPEGLNGKIDADISLKGALPLPQISGKLATNGQFNGEDFELAFNGSQTENIIKFDDVNAKWLNTSVIAKGELSQDQLDMTFKLSQFQISELSRLGLTLPTGAAIPSGLLDIQLDLSGTAKQPQLSGSIDLAIAENAIAPMFDHKQEPILFNSQIHTEEDRLILHNQVLKGSETKADLNVGLRLTPLVNWFLSQDSNPELGKAWLDLSAHGEMKLAWLNDWLQQDAQFFSGLLSLDMNVLGSFADPELAGNLSLTDGTYQNAISQTSLQQANIVLKFDKQKIEVINASASDGQNGQLRLQGVADLGASGDKQIDLTLFLDRASLLRREDIEGEASGQLKLAGSLQDMRLSGNLDVAPFQIMLDRIASDSIPEIQVRTVQPGKTASNAKAGQTTVQLDLVVNVDQQAFIRGRGLEAELKGKLQLSGTNHQTNYNGRFQVIRGTVDLFAKTFKIEQGSVLFSNDAVSLFAQARHKSKDLTFIATLEGLLDNLKISLRTEPALPEDEAVARLLFGKSVRNITPVQAIQLANAIQTLRGEGGGFDPLGTARDILQVDRITIESQETSEGNGVAIGLGKYVTEKVYVEVSRTPEPTQPWKGSVEVELTPNINLETTTSGSSGFGGVELQWKRDY